MGKRKKNKIVDFPEGGGVEPKKAEPRVLLIGTARHTAVMAMDNKGAGNANHRYQIINAKSQKVLDEIHFQDGPIKEAGINGIHNEDLIAIVIDRMEGFQNSEFGCAENAMAMIKLEEGRMTCESCHEKAGDGMMLCNHCHPK